MSNFFELPDRSESSDDLVGSRQVREQLSVALMMEMVRVQQTASDLTAALTGQVKPAVQRAVDVTGEAIKTPATHNGFRSMTLEVVAAPNAGGVTLRNTDVGMLGEDVRVQLQRLGQVVHDLSKVTFRVVAILEADGRGEAKTSVNNLLARALGSEANMILAMTGGMSPEKQVVLDD